MSDTGLTLVTGATGFVGQHLTERLLQDGFRVRALIRHDSGAPVRPEIEAARVEGIHDRSGMRGAMEGVDTVIHLAARVHVMDDRAVDPISEFRRVNVEGTRVLLEEAIAAGVKRFIFISSVKAVGENNDTPWTELVNPQPVDPYGISKLEAERLVRRLAAPARVDAPILRLPLVYGPGMKANMLRLFDLVFRGVPLPLGRVDNRRSVVYVGNVAEAIRAVMNSPAAGAEEFFVSDGQDLSTPELLRAIAWALNRRAVLLPVPLVLFRTAGRLGDLISPRVRFPLTTAAVQRLLGSLSVDSTKLQRVTGFRPPFSVEEAMSRTGVWYVSRA